jgi:GT2 family glycosyltransferase
MFKLPPHLQNSRIGIGIATKDRWPELEVTLAQLESAGHHLRHPVLVVDDASTTPAPDALTRRFPWIILLRHDTNRGYIVRRNEIARLLPNRYLLILDDDAHPLGGDLEQAADYLDARPGVAALACNILCDETTIPGVPVDTAPFAVQRYIGCSHFLRRKVFLYFGGYRPELVHYAEEGEFCARLLSAGHAVHYFPSLLFRHRVAISGRNTARIAYFQGRNRVLLVLWNFPWWSLPVRLPSALVGTLVLVAPHCYGRVLSGYCAGLAAGLRHHRNRSPLHRRDYTNWRRLPWISQHYRDPVGTRPEPVSAPANSGRSPGDA